MALPRARLDMYGQVLPELADVRQEVLKDRPQNQRHRRLLLAALEEQWGLLLRRGIYAEVSACLIVVDGMIREPIDIGVVRHWRLPGEER